MTNRRKNIKNFSIWSREENKFIIVSTRFVNGLSKAQSEGWGFYRLFLSAAVHLTAQLLCAEQRKSARMALIFSSLSSGALHGESSRELDLNAESDWQLINFEIYLHLNWKVLSEKSSPGSLPILETTFFLSSSPNPSEEFTWKRWCQCCKKSMNKFSRRLPKNVSQPIRIQFIVEHIKAMLPEPERKSTKKFIKCLVYSTMRAVMLFELRLPLFVCAFFMPFTMHNRRIFHGFLPFSWDARTSTLDHKFLSPNAN